MLFPGDGSGIPVFVFRLENYIKAMDNAFSFKFFKKLASK
jgi:hypothetical protein